MFIQPNLDSLQQEDLLLIFHTFKDGINNILKKIFVNKNNKLKE